MRVKGPARESSSANLSHFAAHIAFELQPEHPYDAERAHVV